VNKKKRGEQIMIFKNKKGITWQQLVLAILAVFVVVLVIVWFKGGGEKGFEFVKGKIGELEDSDKDSVADMFDKCPCDDRVGQEWTDEIDSKEKCEPCPEES